MSEPLAGAEEDRKETLASSTYERLRHEILTAALPPGAKLHIRALCDRLEIGLSPVREALSRLSTEGLVTQIDHRGFFVAPLTEADLADVTKARCWIGEVGLRHSIAEGDAAWEESVLLAFHRLSRTPRHDPARGPAGPADRNPAWEAAHRHFHARLTAASGSQWLQQACEQLFDRAERYRHLARLAGVTRSSSEEEHKAIMEATIGRRADEAVALLNAHFTRTADLVRKVLAG
ncbi:GntR family transcriptional regulator [Roseomonas populi]|uniref:FCD domain-containing protein n=1 Tax=Roseomonas populi TaxID=3121582 RepID=A0ABT1XEX2_9PROT|nr:GntR family transcriptional regulator [Roseomonas pecuniae]MCR0985697.1 FCD domain-containing protein [Roseomonas pecuniae]